ncbi:BnaA06g40710D [Brassica napus]|uniref:BnaA06g40710D protein n=1 Tax=Brassica napus TaxID=3708 RepID=A0A078J0T3_BRANA|nr:BnaA06g40710D [Brassica napus]
MQLSTLTNVPGDRDVTKMANCGGKIAILCNVEKCSTEIGLERRKGGEVWGTILWSGLVLSSENFSNILENVLEQLCLIKMKIYVNLSCPWMLNFLALVSFFYKSTDGGFIYFV